MKGKAQKWYRSPHFTMTDKDKLEWSSLFSHRHASCFYIHNLSILLYKASRQKLSANSHQKVIFINALFIGLQLIRIKKHNKLGHSCVRHSTTSTGYGQNSKADNEKKTSR